jgi:hypothetical protein
MSAKGGEAQPHPWDTWALGGYPLTSGSHLPDGQLHYLCSLVEDTDTVHLVRAPGWERSLSPVPAGVCQIPLFQQMEANPLIPVVICVSLSFSVSAGKF